MCDLTSPSTFVLVDVGCHWYKGIIFLSFSFKNERHEFITFIVAITLETKQLTNTESSQSISQFDKSVSEEAITPHSFDKLMEIFEYLSTYSNGWVWWFQPRGSSSESLCGKLKFLYKSVSTYNK